MTVCVCVCVCEGGGERREKLFVSYEFRCTAGDNNRNLTTSAKSPTFVPQNPAGQKRWLTEQEIKTKTLVLLSMPVRPTAAIPENNQELCTLPRCPFSFRDNLHTVKYRDHKCSVQ